MSRSHYYMLSESHILVLNMIIIVGRRIKIFIRLKADGKIVEIDTSVASFAKVLRVNKS